jgi:7-alpha-hydroxysteroid dehydrogenase
MANVFDLFRLDGLCAVVTGGGTGIGRAMALGLAEAGADVAVAGRRAAPLDAVVAEITALGRRGLAVQTDVTVASELDRLAARVVSELGAPSIWINNAGGLQGDPMGTIDTVGEDVWHSIVDRNFTSVFLASKAALGVMTDGGSIINLSSIAAMRDGVPGHSVYSAA